MSETLTIGRLARAAAVNVETIRYYQRRGLLDQPDKPSVGYRRYSSDTVKHVRFIKQAQALGFTLKEIGKLLRLEGADCCAETRNHAARKLALIEAKLADLTAMRDMLVALIRQCDTENRGASCPIIHAFKSAGVTVLDMNETDAEDHWQQVYLTKPAERLGWYTPHLRTSLNWIKDMNLTRNDPIIDVGGGASSLVDDLLDEGYRAISVLDLSKAALSSVKARLGERAAQVTWLEGDITSVDLPIHHYALWHDRAVFHFLTTPEQQQKYREQLLKALRPEGHVIIGTFAPEAPPRCSGLPVQRYSLEQLKSVLGREFELKRDRKELHVTPGGVEQMYLYCHFRRLA